MSVPYLVVVPEVIRLKSTALHYRGFGFHNKKKKTNTYSSNTTLHLNDHMFRFMVKPPSGCLYKFKKGKSFVIIIIIIIITFKIKVCYNTFCFLI
jgi:hypothetical protein